MNIHHAQIKALYESATVLCEHHPRMPIGAFSESVIEAVLDDARANLPDGHALRDVADVVSVARIAAGGEPLTNADVMYAAGQLLDAYELIATRRIATRTATTNRSLRGRRIKTPISRS